MIGRAVAALACALIPACVLVAACGSVGPGAPGQAPPAGQATVPLATSLVSPAGNSYAIVEMGRSAAEEDNFWQLFARPSLGAAWHLATPLGVADNGGLVAAATGAASMLTGFRPSQDLLFSPLATTADGGASWSASAPLPGGLANVPGALAAGPTGQQIALTDAGTVLVRSGPQARWSVLTTLHRLDATPAGHACALTALTGAAFSPDGTPLLAADCGRAGTVGIFAATARSWQLASPLRSKGGPVRGKDYRAEVLALSTSGSTTTGLLRVGAGRSASLVAAWLTEDGQWSVSGKLPIGAGTVLSASIWPGGGLGVVLSGGRAAVLTGISAGWLSLPRLPAGTATLAPEPGAPAEALTATRGTFRAFELKAGSWQLGQTIKVAIPYGSSS